MLCCAAVLAKENKEFNKLGSVLKNESQKRKMIGNQSKPFVVVCQLKSISNDTHAMCDVWWTLFKTLCDRKEEGRSMPREVR